MPTTTRPSSNIYPGSTVCPLCNKGELERVILSFLICSNLRRPKEFLECMSHVRIMCWILLGSLQHTALMKCHSSQSICLISQPIPIEASTHIAEHVQAILAGFAEQSKASVLHMSALFYAFLLCQLWTIYCEQLASHNPPGSEAAHQGMLILSDFWSKVTPGVLQLICHSKGVSEYILGALCSTLNLVWPLLVNACLRLTRCYFPSSPL